MQNIKDAICSMVWKRDNSIVLFGSWFGEKFADNSRFLYQYLNDNKGMLGLTHVVWVTRNQSVYRTMVEMNYEVYMMDTKESIFYHKKAGMHVVCNGMSDGKYKSDIEPRYSFGAKRVNLWHGVGAVKGVGNASREYKLKKQAHRVIYGIKELLSRVSVYRKLVMGQGGWADFYFLSPTETTTKQFKEFFYLPDCRYISTLYPRTCECLRLTKSEEKVINIIFEYEKVILYLPTFRTGDNKFDFTTLSDGIVDVLKDKNVLWIQKSHTANAVSSQNARIENVMNLSPDFDINVLLPHITLLVTDYSSVASDARFFNKPILFYVPDYEEYVNGDNGVTEEAVELLSGPKYSDIDSFREGLKQYLYKPNAAKPDNYMDIRDKYWGESKGYETIWNDICKTIRYNL